MRFPSCEAEFAERTLMIVGGFLAEAAIDDARYGACLLRLLHDRPDGDPRRTIGRKAIDAGRDRGEGNGVQFVPACETQGAPVATREQVVLVIAAAVPDGAHSVNHIVSGKAIALGDLRFACRTAAERPAFR